MPIFQEFLDNMRSPTWWIFCTTVVVLCLVFSYLNNKKHAKFRKSLEGKVVGKEYLLSINTCSNCGSGDIRLETTCDTIWDIGPDSFDADYYCFNCRTTTHYSSPPYHGSYVCGRSSHLCLDGEGK